MNDQRPISGSEPTGRRGFLTGGLAGAAFFGLGGMFGWLTPRAGAREASVAAAGRKAVSGDAYDYNLDAYLKTDPKLLQFEETGRIASGFKELRGLAAMADGGVLLAGDRAIRIFSSSGSQTGEIALPAAPRCVAVAPDGVILAGFKDFVGVCAPGGGLKEAWASLGPEAVVTCVAAGANDVFVADAGGRAVCRFDRSGRLLGRFGKKDPERGIPGFVVPSACFDVALAGEGRLWAANPGRHQLECYTFEGVFEKAWGEPSVGVKGFCGCCNPAHFALLPDGRFVTCEKGLPRVKVYSAAGEFEGVVAGPESFPGHMARAGTLPSGMDVATDARDRVYVADSVTGETRIFTRLQSPRV